MGCATSISDGGDDYAGHVVTALYRRYRPESFAELIGQAHVTDPLRAALRGDRVNHAYLFSGPRGCGKTTSARILARCLNCAEGPTDTPCGVCPSCIELARDGSGSLDVVEIDAASHNGVDDARDLRERAVFAPARDRYKIFILDEAHMVTPQGFNALLKIVEEPPEHVKFIFATTEPEKVIGTIRSRTHHYPFRLVPPAQLLEYVQHLSDTEKVTIEPGVLPLVVRAGGGSVRDTLSLLDQLIAGSDDTIVTYERAVALLGYTHGALLDDVVVAIAGRDAGAAFHAVDRVIQTGQDPRRFVEDLLERLRDLIVVQATADGAASVLHGIPADDLQSMRDQAAMFAAAELSRAADVVNRALTEMTGATSPRLHLELMTARVLVALGAGAGASASAGAGAVFAVAPVAGAGAPAPTSTPPVAVAVPVPATVETQLQSTPASTPAAVPTPGSEPTPAHKAEAGPVTIAAIQEAWPAVLDAVQQIKRSSWTVVFGTTPFALDDDVLTMTFASEADATAFKQRAAPADSVSEHVRTAIQSLVGVRVKFRIRVNAAPEAHASPEAPGFSPPSASAPASPPAEEPLSNARPSPASSDAAPPKTSIDPAGPQKAVTDWVVTAIPGGLAQPSELSTTASVSSGAASATDPGSGSGSGEGANSDSEPAADPPAESSLAPAPTAAPEGAAVQHPADEAGRERYGESVLREILGATFLLEEAVEPIVTADRPSSVDAPDPMRDEF